MNFAKWTTSLLAVATVVLAGATWQLNKKAFELETQPHFAFKNFHFKVFVEPSDKNDGLEKTRLKIGLIFRNPGKVLIRYEVKSLRLTFGGQTIDNPQFATRGGSIYPEEETLFWYGESITIVDAYCDTTVFQLLKGRALNALSLRVLCGQHAQAVSCGVQKTVSQRDRSC